MSKQEILSELRGVIREPENHFIRAWKDSGRPVVGYFCTYVPVELFLAGGILPVRLRGAGSTDSSLADAYLSTRICSYVRHTMALALDDKYNFLDGEVSLNTCDHVRRAHDLWRKKTGVKFHGFISVPRNVRQPLFPWYLEEVQRLKAGVEDHFKLKITDEGLRQAVEIRNKVRSRLVEIDSFRGRDEPRLTGEEALTVAIASQVMPPDEFIERADSLISELKKAQGLTGFRGRVLLAGGELDEPAFVRAIEDQGALVAGDMVCFGHRSYADLIECGEAEDPLTSICSSYFFHTPCSRMIGNFPDRFEVLMRHFTERRADGIIFQRIIFCDPWGVEGHNISHRLKKMNIPCLVLHREYGIPAKGQVSTRVQGFLEAMGK